MVRRNILEIINVSILRILLHGNCILGDQSNGLYLVYSGMNGSPIYISLESEFNVKYCWNVGMYEGFHNLSM